jgi:hypothetical protein
LFKVKVFITVLHFLSFVLNGYFFLLFAGSVGGGDFVAEHVRSRPQSYLVFNPFSGLTRKRDRLKRIKNLLY